MSRRLRVFVSSTMKDLANERDAVCRRLLAFNFEPVNAEGWLPTGTGTWSRISQEIESSDVFLLLLGDRYGWIPTKGPQSDTGLAVTHLEFRDAVKRGLPILPFMKRLAYDSDRASDDARKRDGFREEVAGWAEGRTVAEFELASDLADGAAHALVGLLTDEFVTPRIRERASTAGHAAHLLEVRAGPSVPAEHAVLPERLVAAVARREAVLFAGAGISLSAGLPSAAAFAESFSQLIQRKDPEYAVSPGGAAFASIARDFEVQNTREALVAELTKLLDPPQGLQPTLAHSEAVRLFDVIMTTNWDGLFEKAATARNEQFTVIVDDLSAVLPERAIIKLHGSLGQPASLLVTESDVLKMDKSRPRLWEAVREIMHQRTLVVVGTTLRDPSIIRLLEEARPRSPGYLVVPKFSAVTAARIRAWNLECIAVDADSFFARLAAIAGPRPA